MDGLTANPTAMLKKFPCNEGTEFDPEMAMLPLATSRWFHKALLRLLKHTYINQKDTFLLSVYVSPLLLAVITLPLHFIAI